MYVEHVIKDINTFRVIGSLFRNPTWEMASIVEVCASLGKRRIDMYTDFYVKILTYVHVLLMGLLFELSQ